MRLRLIIPVSIGVCILSFNVSFGQPAILIPYRENNLWGYCDTNSKIFIRPKFEEASTFFRGYAIVRLNKKYGVINAKGDYLIPTDYDQLIDCCTERTVVVKNGRLGLLNFLNGRIILPTVYEQIRIQGFSNLYRTLRSDGSMGLFDAVRKKWLFPEGYSFIEMEGRSLDVVYFMVRKGRKTHRVAITRNGEISPVVNTTSTSTDLPEVVSVEPPPQPELPAERESGGIIHSLTENIERNGKHGWRRTITKNSLTTVDSLPAVYDFVKLLPGDSLFHVQQEGKQSIIDIQQKNRLPFLYDEIVVSDSSFSHGVFIVKQGNYYGLANKDSLILPCEYNRIYPGNSGFPGFVLNKNNKSGAYIISRRTGQAGIYIPPKYLVVFGLTYLQPQDLDRNASYASNNERQRGKYLLFVLKSPRKNGWVGLDGFEYFRE